MTLNNRRSEALRTRVHLQSRGTVPDGFGNMVPGGEFETRHTAWANLHPLRGGETVIASRLEGRQPYLVTMRSSSETREMNESWRIVEKSDPSRVYAITSPPTDPDGRRAWIEALAVLGAPS